MTRESDAREGLARVGEAGAERELKFAADRRTLRAALASPLLGGEMGPPAWRRLKSVYFDTADGDLAEARVALRMRRSAGGWTMGFKRAGQSAFEREETEVKAGSALPDLSLFDAAVARRIEDLAGGEPLAPKFGADIRRAARTIEAGGATIEVAFDQGFLFAGERRENAAEIELELKSGPPEALFDLGLALIEAFPARLCAASKAERAHALIAGKPAEPVRADDAALPADASLDDAIAILLRACLMHFLMNLAALDKGDRVEAVHQMRVAMRRLRSALGLFAATVPSAALIALRAETKRIGAALGEARDWDVFVGRLRDGDLARFSGEPGFDRLLAAAGAKAAKSEAAVARLAGDKTFDRFALRLERLAAARGWREDVSQEALAALDQPIEAFAAASLDRLRRKARKRGRGFRSLTPSEHHALRIAVKHVRYATEFFGAIFHTESAARRYARAAARLQDRLGELNDAQIALRLVKALGPVGKGRAAYAAGLVTGWCARAGEGDAAALRRLWRRFKRTAPFWPNDKGPA